MMLRSGVNRIISCVPSRSLVTKTSEDLAKERYEARANESIEKKRARLLYQSRKRGMLENGVILASFADKYINKLDSKELDQYDRLINLPTNDWDIYYWATKTKPTPSEFETPIMGKLREHMNSKVSTNNQQHSPSKEQEIIAYYTSRYRPRRSYHGKSFSKDVIMPTVRKSVDLEPDFSNVSLVDYEEELFDNGVIKKRGTIMQRMTQWRKDYFLKRIRRTLSSPVSVRHMKEGNEVTIHSQQTKHIDIGSKNIVPQDNCDTRYERNMKHHHFLQFLLNSNFTKDALDYDDEALAWAEMIWHRNYGGQDPLIKLTDESCKTCNEKLHCADPGLPGYLPKELLSKHEFVKKETGFSGGLHCQRCRFASTYRASLDIDLESNEYETFIKQISQRKDSVAIIIVDLTDFPSGIIEGLIDLLGKNFFQRILIVGNKIDLLPYDGPGMIRRVTEVLKSNISSLRFNDPNLHLFDTIVISAKTGFNVPGLVTKLSQFTEDGRDMFIFGSKNSGKSTLFDSLLQSDLSAIRSGDLLSRVSPYDIQKDDKKIGSMLRFPIKPFEGWEIALKQRKYVRLERDYKLFERSFLNNTTNRQRTMPHQSMMINHLDYPPRMESVGETRVSTTMVCSETKHQINDSGSEEELKEIHVDSVQGDLIEKNNDQMKDNNDLPNFSDDHPLKRVSSNEPLSAMDNIDQNEIAGFLHMTPSTLSPNQLHDLLTVDERLLAFPSHETIKPRKYTLRPLQTLFIAGLARIDLLTSNEVVILTIFASRYLPIHVLDSKAADQFYNTFLGTPYLGVPLGDQDRLNQWPKLVAADRDFLVRSDNYYQGQCDIVLSSIGWAMVNLNPDQECLIRAYTPEARGIHDRYPAMVPYIKTQLKHKKLRDTPLFANQDYRNERIILARR